MKRLASVGAGTSGRASEKRLASKMGGRLTPGSGAFRGAKSDIRVKKGALNFQVECKSTKALSMALEFSWMVKVAEEAAATGSLPLLTLSFTDNEGKARAKGDWVAMPSWVLDTLLEGV